MDFDPRIGVAVRLDRVRSRMRAWKLPELEERMAIANRSSGETTRIRYAELTDRGAVDEAIAEFDRLGRDGFLHRHGFGEAREYFLVTDTGRYDSKAIFAAAWLNQFGRALTPDDFSGGVSGAAGHLERLGYTIEVIDTTAARKPRLANAPRATGTAVAARQEATSRHCPSCGLALPVSGACDFC
ncbi:hypothetical protein ACGGZK_06820 [Agromyces sp. MMS24-K17]|uniref:hypothetical protein n=1 Tax=Agromyces sp. MMS24-K17 TaxID=3372850 RepID=UPI003753FD13